MIVPTFDVCHLTTKMFFVLFSLVFSASEKHSHRGGSRGGKRPKGSKTAEPIDDFPFDDFNDFGDFNENAFPQKPAKRNPGNPATQKVKHEKKTKSLPHTIRSQNGKIVCESGYTCGRNITKHGCWRCPSSCKKQEICAYPGVCAIPTPFIIGINQTDKNSNIRVSYEVDDLHYLPEVAYCKINDHIQKAPFVTNKMVPCSPTGDNIKTLMISFDQKQWSNPVMSPVISYSMASKKVMFLIAGTVFVIVIIGAVICVSHSRSRNLRMPARREARQIARFPQTVDEEVVYSSKHPY